MFAFWIIAAVAGALTVTAVTCHVRYEQLADGSVVSTPVCDQIKSVITDRRADRQRPLVARPLSQ